MTGSSTEPLAFATPAVLSRFDPERRLETYFEQLMFENERVNLVSRETSRAGFDRLCAESLLPFQVQQRLGGADTCLDIGSGGGLPLIPMLLCGLTRAGVGLERVQKKAAALKRIVDGLGCAAEILPIDIAAHRPEHRYDLITVRYVKLTTSLLKQIDRLIAPSGLLLYYGSAETDTAGFESTVYRLTMDGRDIVKHFSILSPKNR